jgi:hypothetical protein
MSTPGVNPALTEPTTKTTNTSTTSATNQLSIFGALLFVLASFGGLLGFLLHLAAAKLSYDKYGSIGWAILDFFFGTIYIPYYAFFLNTPSQQPMFGGRPRRR